MYQQAEMSEHEIQNTAHSHLIQESIIEPPFKVQQSGVPSKFNSLGAPLDLTHQLVE